MATNVKTIHDISEIDQPGIYEHYLSKRIYGGDCKTIAIEEDLDEGYCICLDGWRFIMNGWKMRHWKKFESCRKFLLSAAARDEYGLEFWIKGRI